MPLRVLTYHRVADSRDDSWLDPRLISATPQAFERQMTHVRRHYDPVSMNEVVDAIDRGRSLPKKAVLITFDDAYYDFADFAWPILRRLELPATVFVPTAFPDHPERSFWLDRLYRTFHAATTAEIERVLPADFRLEHPGRTGSLQRFMGYLKSRPHSQAESIVEHVCSQIRSDHSPRQSVLSWQQLRELAAEGLAIASHTRNHRLLTRIPLKEVESEVAWARDDLREHLGDTLPVFCYPNGDHDDSVVSVLREAGIRVAFTTVDGHNNLRTGDPLRLRRTNITPRSTPLVFRLRLHRWATILDRWRHGGFRK